MRAFFKITKFKLILFTALIVFSLIFILGMILLGEGPIGCSSSSCDDSGFDGTQPPLIYYLTLPLVIIFVVFAVFWKILVFPLAFLDIYPFDFYSWLIYIPYFYILSCLVNYFLKKSKNKTLENES